MIHIYKGILFDSLEEKQFASWCEELKENGFIHSWEKVINSIEVTPPVSFTVFKTTQLKTKIKEEEKKFTFLKSFSYTPDFKILWNNSGKNLFLSNIGYNMNPESWFFYNTGEDGHAITFVEIKPVFERHGKTDRFSIVQKILWNYKKLFVDLIIPLKLFKGTFLPKSVMEDYKYKKDNTGKWKKGDWKCDFIPKTLKEFLNEKSIT